MTIKNTKFQTTGTSWAVRMRPMVVLASLGLLVAGCGGGGDQPPPEMDVGNDMGGGNYKSNYCVADDITNSADDIFVAFDAFGLASDVPPEIENSESAGDLLLYSALKLPVSGINLQMGLGPKFWRGFCKAETTPDKLCDLVIPSEDGDIKVVGKATLNTLTFEVLQKSVGSAEFDHKMASYTSDVSPYWQGSFTSYGDLETTISWDRTISAEYFNSTSSNGDYFKANEQSDCSGSTSSRTTNENGSVRTIDGFWQLNGKTTSAEVTQCWDGECASLTW